MSLFNRKSGGQGDRSKALASGGDDASKFRLIIDTIQDGVVLIDQQRTIQYINPGACTISGWKLEEATGINIESVLQLINEKGELLPDTNNPIKQVFGTGQAQSSDYAILSTRSKQQVPISLRVSPLLDKDKSVISAVIIFNNVSRERAEEQQRADFISTASHEMRTPVAAIEGYLALALNDKVATIDDRARSYLDKAHSSTQHLGKLFQDLLTSAKAEDGRLTSHPTVIEMGEFLEQLSGDLRLIAEQKGLLLQFFAGNSNVTINATAAAEANHKVLKPLYYVYIDPDRIREVITNLFDNAVKYTPEGKITIGLTGNDRVVQCYVRDTGPGIPAEDLPHLFQKFYRVDNSATRTIGGTGLGLFICRKIVELYNGRIWADSKLGEGSTFFINLPRLTAQKANELKSSIAPDTTANPTNFGGA